MKNKIGYNPKDKIPAANNKQRWQWALESKSCLYVLGLLSDLEKKKIEYRFDKWLTSWNIVLVSGNKKHTAKHKNKKFSS